MRLDCVQVADHIMENPADKTKVSLVFANVSEADILLKVGSHVRNRSAA